MSVQPSSLFANKWKILAYAIPVSFCLFILTIDLLFLYQLSSGQLAIALLQEWVFFGIMASLIVHIYIFFNRTERNKKTLSKWEAVLLILYNLNFFPLFDSLRWMTSSGTTWGNSELFLGSIVATLCLWVMSLLIFHIHPRNYLKCWCLMILFWWTLSTLAYIWLPELYYGKTDQNSPEQTWQLLFYFSIFISILEWFILILAYALLQRWLWNPKSLQP